MNEINIYAVYATESMRLRVAHILKMLRRPTIMLLHMKARILSRIGLFLRNILHKSLISNNILSLYQ